MNLGGVRGKDIIKIHSMKFSKINKNIKKHSIIHGVSFEE